MTRLSAGAGMAPFGLSDMPRTRDGTPLVARCLLLDDGETRIAIVSLSCLGLYSRNAEDVRTAVCEATGLPPEQVLVAATHLHSGPPLFGAGTKIPGRALAHIARAARAAAEQAASALRPARIGCATDHLPGVSRSRRILRRDGSVITLRRAWPQYWGWATDPETVGPEDEVDDLLTVVRVEHPSGEPFAAIMHFTCHPIPDFFGWAAARVECAHPGLICLPLNGCMGTVDTPFEVEMRGRTQQEQLPILGEILAYRTLELLTRAETSNDHRLAYAGRWVRLPVDPRFAENPIAQWEMWRDAVSSGWFEGHVQCLAIGELALVGTPGEPQVSFGRDVERVSPYGLTRCVGNTGRSAAYLLWPAARARGGYEADPMMSTLTGDGALAVVYEAIRECLVEMRTKSTGP